MLCKYDVIGCYLVNKFGLILLCCGFDVLYSVVFCLLNSIVDEFICIFKGIIFVIILIGGVVMF